MKDVLEKMEAAESLAALNAVLQRFLARINIQSFAVTYYDQHTKTGSKLIYDWVSPALKRWHEHYLSEGYADSDRTLESTQHALLPLFWDVREQLANAKNKREARIREESIEFGISKGLCITVYGPLGDFIVLVLHQRKGETNLLDWQEKQFMWLALTQYYFHYLRRHLINDVAQTGIQLTRREQQCLELTAQGLRINAIAESMNVSLRTVNFHIQNANKKLGVNNKYLAILRWKERGEVKT